MKNLIPFLTTLLFGLSACGSGSGSSTTRTLTVAFSGLESLGGGDVYEGWLIVDGAPVTTGRFTINDKGEAEPSSFSVEAGLADRASTFVVTVEPGAGDDAAPSDTHILAGDLAQGAATLSTAHAAALGTDFRSATGAYILATPSTSAQDDEDEGIWWLIPGASGMSAGLELPALPDGWSYEGWVVGSSGAISTGRFRTPTGVDSDAAGPQAGPDGQGPAFPGQDFVNPAMVLTSGKAAVITVEPDPDDSPGPFAIKLLVDMDVEAIAKPATQTMTQNLASLPTGTVSLK